MLLLDHNLPIQVMHFLRSVSVECDTTYNRGWSELTNGNLVSKAADAGFTCILTKDRDFSKSAARALKSYPLLCVVLIVLPQSRGEKYAELFARQWRQRSINLEAGKSIVWPQQPPPKE